MLEFVSEPEKFRNWVEASGWSGKILFTLMVILQVFIAVIPGEPLEIAAGYAFGAVEGTLLCLFGTVIGSMLVFFFVRKFGIQAVEQFFPRKKINQLQFLQKTRQLNLLVFLIFSIPGTPKDILCYFVGLTEMKWSSWLLISATARIPSIVTSTIGGNALGFGAHWTAALIFAATLLVSSIGMLVYKQICKTKGSKP